jgi:CHASE3 domain sensor protein
MDESAAMTVAGQRHARLWEVLEMGLFRELGVPTLVVSLVLFVSAMTLLGANVSELRSGYARVQQTNAALLQIAMVNNDILRDDMVVRGYALSGDPIYLKWQKMAKDSLRTRLVALDKMLADDPDQHAEMQVLKKLVDGHIATFDRLAGLVPTDRSRVIAEIVDYGKKVKRRPIENMLAHLRIDETQRLAERQSEAETRVVSAYRYAIGISTLALLLGAIGFALVIHDRRRRA